MYKSVPIRLILLFFMIFSAYMTSPPWDIQWTKQSGGICEEYTIEHECFKGEEFKEVFKLNLFLMDPRYL